MTPPDTLAFAEEPCVDVDAALPSLQLEQTQVHVALPATRRGFAQMFDRVSSSGMGLLSLFDQGIVSAVNFATMVLIGRAVGGGALAESTAHELGLYQLGFNIVLLATCIQNALICTPYAVFYNRLEQNQRAGYAGNAWLHQWWLSGFITTVLVLAGAALNFGLGPDGVGAMAWMLAIALPFMLLREFIRRVAFAQLQIYKVLLLDSGVALLQLTALVALKLTGNLTAISAFGTIGLACLASASVVFYSMRSQFEPNRNNTIADLHLNWSFGKWSFAAQVAYLVTVSSTSWLLAFMESTDVTGQFAACTSLVMIANPVLIGFNNFLLPKTIHAYNDRGLKGLSQLTIRSSIITLSAVSVLAIVLVCIGGWLGVQIYGDSVAGDRWVIAVLALNMVICAPGMQAENGIIAMGKPRKILWANICGVIATLASGVVLISIAGLMGAAVSLLIGQLTVAIFKAIFYVTTFRELGRAAANERVAQPEPTNSLNLAARPQIGIAKTS